MGWLGRKGDLLVVPEAVQHLAVLALFAGVVIFFIISNAKGEPFQSRFHAVDLATNAQIANAAAGDFLLRYDNIRDDMDLKFWFTAGTVEVGRPTDGSVSQVKGVEIARKHYGLPPFSQDSREYYRPTYLVLRKMENTFLISDYEETIDVCPSVSKHTVPIQDSRVQLALGEGFVSEEAEKARLAFAEVFDSSDIEVVTENPNIIINLKKKFSVKNRLISQPTSRDGRSLVCLFEKQLELLSLIEFDSAAPSLSGDSLTIDITIEVDSSSQVSAEQIGRAMAYALAEYYK